MARREDSKGKTSSDSQNRVQGFVFGISLEGSEDVVSEGIKAFAHAMSKGGIVLTSIPASKPSIGPSKPNTQLPAEAPDPTQGEEDLQEGEEMDTSEEIPTSGNTVARTRRRPAPRAPKFLNELNLTTASVSLESFVKEKAPVADIDKYAVIGVWFKQHFGTDEISLDHIFTGYTSLGWQSQVPTDPGQPLRDLKRKNWAESGKERGNYKINWNGENAVNKMGTAQQ
jgi:hypothetical protein